MAGGEISDQPEREFCENPNRTKLEAGRLPVRLPALLRLEAGGRASRLGTLKCRFAYDDRFECRAGKHDEGGIDEGEYRLWQVRGLGRPQHLAGRTRLGMVMGRALALDAYRGTLLSRSSP
jgi:hypothetical protein